MLIFILHKSDVLDPLTHNTSTLNTVTHHDCRQWELNEMARGYQLKPKGIFLFCSKKKTNFKIWTITFKTSVEILCAYHCWWLTLREKCPYSAFFLSAFSSIWTEYGKSTDEKNSEYGHFSPNVKVSLTYFKVLFNSSFSSNFLLATFKKYEK